MGKLDFGVKAGQLKSGISIGLYFGGPGGAVAGYFIEENVQNGYNTLIWVHEGMYSLP